MRGGTGVAGDLTGSLPLRQGSKQGPVWLSRGAPTTKKGGHAGVTKLRQYDRPWAAAKSMRRGRGFGRSYSHALTSIVQVRRAKPEQPCEFVLMCTLRVPTSHQFNWFLLQPASLLPAGRRLCARGAALARI